MDHLHSRGRGNKAGLRIAMGVILLEELEAHLVGGVRPARRWRARPRQSVSPRCNP